MTTPIRGRRLLAPATAALALFASGCAHVSQERLDEQLATVRADLTREMEEGDRSVRAELGTRIDGVDARLTALRADLRALEEEFDVRVRELESSLRFDVPVYFGFDDATVASRGLEVLDRFGGILREHYPQALVTVEGFTDPAGSEAYNLRLGQRRADAVKAALVADGIAGERIRTVSYGEDVSRLVAPDDQGPGAMGWENRRVVIVVDHAGSTAAPVAATEGGAR